MNDELQIVTRELQTVTQVQAVKIKELGFDWDWNTDKYDIRKTENAIPNVILGSQNYLDANAQGFLVLAPTIARASKWLREKHSIWVEVFPDWSGDSDLEVATGQWGSDVRDLKDDTKSINGKEWYDSFEQAELLGLDCALDYLLNKRL